MPSLEKEMVKSECSRVARERGGKCELNSGERLEQEIHLGIRGNP